MDGKVNEESLYERTRPVFVQNRHIGLQGIEYSSQIAMRRGVLWRDLTMFYENGVPPLPANDSLFILPPEAA